jgi:hypothetical protein
VHMLVRGALLCREGTLVGVSGQAKEIIVRGMGRTIALGKFSKARARGYTTIRQANTWKSEEGAQGKGHFVQRLAGTS